ncbi:hypothetical protein E6P09_11790 [Haloferax mediterranei ATCC 33500]|uniref:Uncharacterized protein n=1 Tax=Haloferax mediterranei (strain ATCC 33500 / DSM 1411 / JCM 8866 / NBRC 14739 / NCIMB 2177 / R-4) TaxID=523841 RepID=I3R5E8_HALMT|nr:hypothetical protein [Haloferax mediterranei]AFK19458.1 hypothetical protein HFX_1752 [Haloferax mediterranei ATCC 33500]AHZ21196.1 hypothetical protein BM92_00355 [Haloferax mediterranei ATCC 33500]EMA04355.1 hypothetical protein C439_01732 [Haloferax mediterranei ATCC 33500]MDX5989560.1 hypothetical protein [Haloferax mediterranei ATCC 33500]QCQ75918.1 hypothetical protein E6P09_11790 [Haloferax mediterranei ATCC 33500]
MRETHLTDCDFDAAQSAAAHAVDYMSSAFEAEFPDVPASRAAYAGELFMRALFLQDEIENRAAFDECLEHDVSDDVFVSSPAEIPEIVSINDDPRWSDVQDLLEVVCDELEMDSEYAVLHTRFWRLHGQRRDNWQTIARRAHRIKVARMVPEADDETIDNLARYFVAGVSRHDGWVREGPERDVTSTLDIVAQYYHRLFDLRTS